jgi:hypothetical protein
MWLSIISLVDKIFGILQQLTGFWIQRSDASKQFRDKAQAEMDEAVKKGDSDAYFNARARRNCA